MRVSELADRSGVPATTLRFYESQGLLTPGRTPAGYRDYDEEAVDRVAFIGVAKRLGLSLTQAGELLDAWGAGVCADLKADLRPRLAERLTAAQEQAAQAMAFVATLRSAVDRLDALPDRAGPCTPECADLTAPASVPVACSLSAGDLDDRVGQWRAVAEGATRSDIPGGVRLTLPVERAGAVAALAADEQACCPFLDFRLHLDGTSLHVEVRAPAEAAGLLDDLFPPSRSDG